MGLGIRGWRRVGLGVCKVGGSGSMLLTSALIFLFVYYLFRDQCYVSIIFEVPCTAMYGLHKNIKQHNCSGARYPFIRMISEDHV